MKLHFLAIVLLSIVLIGCSDNKKKETVIKTLPYHKQDSLIYSFSFVGCNRVDYSDKNNPKATDKSTANLAVLKKIYNNIANLKKKPDALFFLGDLVLAESDTINLNNQLTAWLNLYKNKEFSKISTSGVELVAVPGNHEMLYYKKYKSYPKHHEWPLEYATKVWMQHMAPYMPIDRDIVTGKDSIVNQMTFSFTRKNIAFIVMNTDTYNTPTKENGYGIEGQIPLKWILQKVKFYKENTHIKHIFVLGHRPYYISGKPETGHAGLPQGKELWRTLENQNVIAMLSAHVHDYQRMQPNNKGTYQIIAGNGGSKGTATFFGYSTINIYNSGKIELKSKGIDVGTPYYTLPKNTNYTLRDSTVLTATPNTNPYPNFK